MTRQEVWPNFFIVGVAKAGTTSLAAWLRQHPEVFIPKLKEPRYFSHDLADPGVHNVVRSREAYLALFARAGRYKARGEASTSYFTHWRHVPERIKEAVPEARIIILLRDPVERAYSSYLMMVRRGDEKLPFAEAVRKSPFASRYCTTYAQPVRKYFEVFGRERVLVLMFEDLKRDPYGLLKTVARFLDIDEAPMARVNVSVENPGGVPRGPISRLVFALRRRLPVSVLPLPKGVKAAVRRRLLAPKPPMDPAAIAHLRAIFEPDLQELEKLLGRPLPELRKGW